MNLKLHSMDMIEQNLATESQEGLIAIRGESGLNAFSANGLAGFSANGLMAMSPTGLMAM